jgi:hypothetical protein
LKLKSCICFTKPRIRQNHTGPLRACEGSRGQSERICLMRAADFGQACMKQTDDPELVAFFVRLGAPCRQPRYLWICIRRPEALRPCLSTGLPFARGGTLCKRSPTRQCARTATYQVFMIQMDYLFGKSSGEHLISGPA